MPGNSSSSPPRKSLRHLSTTSLASPRVVPGVEQRVGDRRNSLRGDVVEDQVGQRRAVVAFSAEPDLIRLLDRAGAVLAVAAGDLRRAARAEVAGGPRLGRVEHGRRQLPSGGDERVVAAERVRRGLRGAVAVLAGSLEADVDARRGEHVVDRRRSRCRVQPGGQSEGGDVFDQLGADLRVGQAGRAFVAVAGGGIGVGVGVGAAEGLVVGGLRAGGVVVLRRPPRSRCRARRWPRRCPTRSPRSAAPIRRSSGRCAGPSR